MVGALGFDPSSRGPLHPIARPNPIRPQAAWGPDGSSWPHLGPPSMPGLDPSNPALWQANAGPGQMGMYRPPPHGPDAVNPSMLASLMHQMLGQYFAGVGGGQDPNAYVSRPPPLHLKRAEMF